MKTLLVAINAKFEHEGLAVWCLKAACQHHGLSAKVMQFSINDSAQRIWAYLLGENPDILAFSCYIWNRELVMNLISDIKKARPSIVVMIGGPEASYDGSEQDFSRAGADFIIKGEGENKLPYLLKAISEGGVEKARAMPGASLGCREEPAYYSPFLPEYLQRIQNRIAYIESSRGCPYRCSYCLSSESRGLVLFPLEEVKEDIEGLVAAGAKVIKFVDRSFNVNEAHSLGIWEFIRKFPKEKVTFHFEINPDRLTRAQMESLLSMPAGLVQLEAGIQSANPETLKEVSRVMNVKAALKNLRILAGNGNLHIHADLIAGLPYEDMASFRNSFNRVYAARPHHLQLGFLKLLHGTRIRREAMNHGYKYREYPPYEVIENRYIKSDEFLELKGVEEILDRLYNSGRLFLTLDYLATLFETPYDLYDSLSRYFKERELLYMPISASRLYETVRSFADALPQARHEIADSLLALDYCCSVRTTVLPEFLQGSRVKTLDSAAFVDESVYESTGKKELRKRFVALEGSFLIKNKEDFFIAWNRILVDAAEVDPVTGRAGFRPLE